MTNLKAPFFNAARDAEVALDVYVVCDRRLTDLPRSMAADATCKLNFAKPGLALHIEDTGFRGRCLLDGEYHNVAVAWAAVFMLQRADGRHLVDWATLPESVCAGMTLSETKAAYVRMLGEQAQFYGAVSLGMHALGTLPVQDARGAQPGRLLPNGWRVISGGAR